MSSSAQTTSAGVVWVVLEQCSLETVKTKRGFELLNCDDHGNVCRRNKRDPADYRPDIVHQVLLALLDSPLNKAGALRVLMLTKKNVLIDVLPTTRIPRTFKRFAGLMVQLLSNLRVRAADTNETLLKVVKNPVSSHLPVGCTVVGLEVDAELVDAFDVPRRVGVVPTLLVEAAPLRAAKRSRGLEADALSEGLGSGAGAGAGGGMVDSAGAKSRDIAFVIGAMSHGNINPDYVTKTLSLSRYPLSAACTVSKLMNAFEHAWGIL